MIFKSKNDCVNNQEVFRRKPFLSNLLVLNTETFNYQKQVKYPAMWFIGNFIAYWTQGSTSVPDYAMRFYSGREIL